MADGSGLIVRGGPGGTTANLEDIERCAVALRKAAKALGDADYALGSIQWELSSWDGSVAATNFDELNVANLAGHARLAVDAARPRLLHLATDLSDDARDVDSARRQYEEAESLASKALRIAVGAVFPMYDVVRVPALVKELPTLPVVLAEHAKWRAGLGLPADFFEQYVHVFAAQIVQLGPGHVRVIDDPVPLVAGLLAHISNLYSVPKEVVVQPVIGGVRQGKGPRGAKDLIDKFGHGRDPNGTERIQVTKVTNRDGSVAWEVTIPGTQDWSPIDGHHPNNLKSNFELFAGWPSHATAAVDEAMKLAGVGEDEPVVLAGHSQGGMVAQAIAGAGTFNVVAVLTAGTPLGGVHQRSTVPTLAVEHESDVVPAADGKQNPDDPLTTTVRIQPDGHAKQSPIHAHESAKYAETAALADADDADSLVEWRKILAETFDEDAVAETRIYDASLRPLG